MSRKVLLLAVLLITACTRSLHPPEAEPLAKVPLLSAPVETQSYSGEWVQDTVQDFQGGTLQGTVVTDTAGGEVTLAPSQTQGSYLAAVHAVGFDLTTAGAEWQAAEPVGSELRVEVRTSPDGTAWSAWVELQPDPDHKEDPGSTEARLGAVQRGRFLQYRLTLSTADPAGPPVLQRIRLVFLNTSAGPSLAQAKAMLVPKAAIVGVPEPDVIARQGWGADESLLDWEPEYRPVRKIIVHHTAMQMRHLEPAAAVRAIYTYHARTRGWGDIGYNYLIDWLGNVYQGRAGGEGVVGGHNLEFNYGSVGIALIGDYSRQAPPGEQMEALARLVSYLADRWGIDPQGSSDFLSARAMPDVSGHRDTRSTSCPGDGVYHQLPALRQQVWQRMLQFPPRVELKGLPDGGAVSGSLELVAESPSPHLEALRLSLDGTPLAEGRSPVKLSLDTTALAEGEHELLALAVSRGGQSQTVKKLLTVDNGGPQGRLLIEAGRPATNQRQVTLTLEVEDPSGVQAMALAGAEEDPTEFGQFAPEVAWELPEEEGRHTVRARFRDGLGHVSEPVEATILLDTTPPGDWGSLILEGPSLQIGVTDTLSGLDPSSAGYGLSTDGGQTWSEWLPAQVTGQEGTTDPQTVILTGQIGPGNLRVQVKDMAGNVGQSPVLDSPGIPTPTPLPSPTPTATATATPTTAPTATRTPAAPSLTATPTPPPEPSPGAPPTGLPDLLPVSLTLHPAVPQAGQPVQLAIEVTNQGGSSSPGFWVQLCVDPQGPPRINQVCTVDAVGAYWFVDRLEPGETVVLTGEGIYPGYSNFPGFFLPGRHELYVYVDAYHTIGTVGLVEEASELNNLLGPVPLEVPGQAARRQPTDVAQDLWRELPPWLRLYLKELLESVFPASGR